MPLWEELAQISKEEEIPLKIAKIDCTVEKEICTPLSLIGYPTLILYMDSLTTIYSGIRSIETLLNYYNDKNTRRDLRKAEVEQSLLPTDVITLNTTNFDSETLASTVLIMFYAPWCKHSAKLSILWEEIARTQKPSFKTAKLDCTSQSSLCQKYEIRSYPTVKLFISGSLKETYRGERTYEAYINLVTHYLNPQLEKQTPSPSIVNTHPNPNPNPNLNLNKENLSPLPPTSVKSTVNLNIKERLASTNAESDEDHVIVLNSENWQEMISEGPILVKFFAPWCGHCKALAPTWKSLASKYLDIFAVAKLDCTLYPEICVNQGVVAYPTIKLFIEGKDYLFKGVRDIKAFANFVENTMLEEMLSSEEKGEL
jgi:protein disulfide-isomerase-like protein